LKKCPSCGSIASDEDDKCGVCGTSLLDVRSTNESLEQAELELNAKEKADDQRLDRAQKKGLRRETMIGLLTGIILVLLGGWLFITGFVGGPFIQPLNGWAILIGLVILVLGITSTETVLDVYKDAPYHGWGWWLWISPLHTEEEEREKEQEERE
jgi:hypothetical protein